MYESDSNTESASGRKRAADSGSSTGPVGCLVLLMLQPVIFYWQVLINPRYHIPYDIEGFHLPLISYIGQCVRSGIAPLWDPYSYCGTPIHADLQAQLYYPLNWLAILASSHTHGRTLYYWVEVLVPLHMALAGIFVFLLLRKMGLRLPAALLGANSYQLGGYFASQAQHLGAICAATWLPLGAIAVYELRFRLRPRWIAVLSLAIAMSILSGFAAATVVVGVAVSMFAAALLTLGETKWSILPGTVAGFIAGAAISSVELVPAWGLTQASIASERGHWFSLGGGLPLEALVSLVIPDHYHVFETSSLYKLPYNFTFLYTYCGLATVILAATGPLLRIRRAVVFFLLTVLAALWMLGEHTPVYRFMYVRLPELIRGALYSEFALMAFCFFLAISAAIVLDKLGDSWPYAVVWGIALLTGYDLIHTGSGRPMNSYLGGYKTEDAAGRVSTEIIAEKLRTLSHRTLPPSRVDYTDAAFSAGIYGAGATGIPTPDGDNPFMLLRVNHLRRQFTAGQPWERRYPVTRFDSPLLGMLNVAYVAGAVPIPTDELKRAGLEFVEEVRGIQIYRNPHALARFFLVPRIRSSSSEVETLQLLTQSSFRPDEEAIVEGIRQDRQDLGAGSAQVTQYSPNRVELTVTADRGAFLASSEVLYPGWAATVNGAPQRFLMTNGAFRGLMLPAGTSRIVMSYHPQFLDALLFFSLFGLVAMSGIAVLAEGRSHLMRAPLAWEAVRAKMSYFRDLCTAELRSRQSSLVSLFWICLVSLTFYWKVLLTSRFSLLVDPDVVGRSYSWLQFWIYNIRHGTIPLRDPYTLGRTALFSGGAVFNPLHFLLALIPLGRNGLLSPHLYHLWFVSIHLVAACFMFGLARELPLGRLPAILSAICYSCGGAVGRTSSLDRLEGYICLPLALYFLLRAVRADHRRAIVRNATYGGLALAISIVAGGSDLLLPEVLVAISAMLFTSKSRARSVLASGIASLIAIAIASVQVLLTTGYRPQSAQPLLGELWPHSIVGMLAPAAFHGALGGGKFIIPYIGVLPLLLAVVAVWRNWRDQWVRYLAGLCLIAFLYSLGSRSLLYGVISSIFPTFLGSASEGAYVVGFGMSLLAGIGFATALSNIGQWLPLTRILWAIAGLTGIVLLVRALSGQEIAPELGMSAVLIPLSCLLLSALFNQPSRWTPVMALALVLFDLNSFDQLSRDRREAENSGADAFNHLLSFREAARFLRSQVVPSRIELPSSAPAGIGEAFGVSTVAAGNQDRLDLLNVRYRLAAASSDEPGPVYQDAFWKIYERPNYCPRAWTVHQVVLAQSVEQQRTVVAQAGFDPLRIAAVDRQVTLDPPADGASDGVEFVRIGINSLELHVDAKSQCLLVLSEPFFPGWRATVNGSETPIYRADGSLRAIKLPRGDARVIMNYSPLPTYYYFWAIVVIVVIATHRVGAWRTRHR